MVRFHVNVLQYCSNSIFPLLLTSLEVFCLTLTGLLGVPVSAEHPPHLAFRPHAVVELPRASNSKLTRENNRYIFNAYYNASTSTTGVRVLLEFDVSTSVSVVDLNLAG